MVTAAPCRASSMAMARPMPLSLPVTRAALLSRDMGALLGASAEALQEVVANAQGIGHRRQGRVHGPDAREEAGIDDIQVVELVGLAVDVEDGGRSVGPEPDGAGLVGDAGDGDLVLE